jgi:predicted nucleic acid-binding protein
MPGKSSSDLHTHGSGVKAGRIRPDSVVCDSSSLISLTDSGLLGALMAVKQRMKGDLLVTEGVIEESITNPIKVPEYSFSAVRLKRALNSGAFGIAELTENTFDRILNAANNMFYTNRPFHLVNHGEAEMLAAAIDNNLTTLLMDERTTRTLIEAPIELKNHLENEFHIRISVNQDMFNEFKEMTKGLQVIRSAEVLALANERGYFKKYKDLSRQAYEAALYAIKFNGCSIGFDEIKELAKLG